MINAPLRQQGFTLVELLVALFVFGLISAAGVTLLRSSADGQIALKERLSGHSALMRSANLIESDLAQVVPRPIRDSLGRVQPAFTSNPGALGQDNTGGRALFIFTRTGLSAGNVDGASAIARIGYDFSDGALRRISWRGADGAAAMPAVILLDELTSVSVRFRGRAGQWRSDWSFADPLEIPRAAELTITPKSRPPFRMMMLVGTQLRPAEPRGEEEGNSQEQDQGQSQSGGQGQGQSQGQNQSGVPNG